MRRRFDQVARRVTLAAVFLLWSIAALHSFTFEPMSVAFEPSGPLSIRTFRLKNEGSGRIAIRVGILTRQSAEDGSERNEAVAEGKFLVFPSRFILEAGASRSLKVQWKGGDPGKRELAYRIVAEQVPVDFQAKQGSGISLLFKYVGALYIRPPEAPAADVKVVSAVGADSKGKRGIELRLSNGGGIHVILTDFKVSLASSSGILEGLPPDALVDIEGNNLLAGTERVFFVPYGKAEIGAFYDARIEFDPEY